MPSTENRAAAERAAIAESMSSETEVRTFDEDSIVRQLAEIKQLKAHCLENPDDESLIAELERKSDSVKAEIEALVEEDVESAQELVARGYRESAFDPVDLTEMGFDSTTKDRLSERMA